MGDLLAAPVGSVVTIGETMALLDAPSGRGLRTGSRLPVGIGGAESNVAIGLARLGVPCTWISRVGADAFGALVTREIRAEGVTVIAAQDQSAPTGLMVKEHRGGRPVSVRYYRAGSAASRLTAADLDEAAIASAAVLHLTGITPALGPGPLRAVERAIEIARASGTLVSFDVNYRSKLWSAEQAGPVLAGLAGSVDLLFAGPEEAALLLGLDSSFGAEAFDDGEHLARGLAKLGPGTVVVKLGCARLARPFRRPRASGADEARHGRRRGRRWRCLCRRLPQRACCRRERHRLPGHGQPARRGRVRGPRRLGGTAHPGRTERARPDRRRHQMTPTSKGNEKSMSPQSLLTRCPIVPVVVIHDAAQALPLGEALLAGGIDVAEITLRTAAGIEAIRILAAKLPALQVGAGSVLVPRRSMRSSMPARNSSSVRGCPPRCWPAPRNWACPRCPASPPPPN